LNRSFLLLPSLCKQDSRWLKEKADGVQDVVFGDLFT
jgi:hypothetical protein